MSADEKLELWACMGIPDYEAGKAGPDSPDIGPIARAWAADPNRIETLVLVHDKPNEDGHFKLLLNDLRGTGGFLGAPLPHLDHIFVSACSKRTHMLQHLQAQLGSRWSCRPKGGIRRAVLISSGPPVHAGWLMHLAVSSDLPVLLLEIDDATGELVELQRPDRPIAG